MSINVFARHFVALVAIAFGLVSEEAKPLRVCAFSLFRARQPELKVDNQMVLLRLFLTLVNQNMLHLRILAHLLQREMLMRPSELSPDQRLSDSNCLTLR